jgi:hypothetical protein
LKNLEGITRSCLNLVSLIGNILVVDKQLNTQPRCSRHTQEAIVLSSATCKMLDKISWEIKRAKFFFVQYDIIETGKRDNLPIREKKISKSEDRLWQWCFNA